MIPQEILSQIKSGATVRVWEALKEGGKERLSKFEGLVLARKHGSEQGATFTVMATLEGVGVEKVYPIHSPRVKKIEILSSPRKVGRSKLYYLRNLSKKEIRRKVGLSREKTAIKPIAK